MMVVAYSRQILCGYSKESCENSGKDIGLILCFYFEDEVKNEPW